MGSSVMIRIISEISIIYLFHVGHYVERNTIYLKYKWIHRIVAILKVNNTSKIFQSITYELKVHQKFAYLICYSVLFFTSIKDFLRAKIEFYTSSNSKLHRYQACICRMLFFQGWVSKRVPYFKMWEYGIWFSRFFCWNGNMCIM